MSQRQGRRSLGLAPMSTVDDGPTELQRFEDFRRKHSKQNKEIIMDNITRKTIIKSLQDDIAKLHMELSQVRQANLVLQAKVTRMQRQAGKMGGQPVRDALDQLITALPALRQLRDTLTIIQPQTDDQQPKATLLNAVENTYATRPAEMARQAHGLGAVLEGSECESERSAGEERKVRLKSRSRHTGVGSIAASRSPRRTVHIPSYVDMVDRFLSSPTPSPSKSASPRPKKASSTAPTKQKRRRESGLISLPARSPSPVKLALTRAEVEGGPGPSTPQSYAGEGEGDRVDAGETSEWDEGGAVELQPTEAATLVSEEAVMPQEGVVTRTREPVIMYTIREASNSGSSGGSGSSRGTSYQPSSPPSDANTRFTLPEGTADDVGIGRGRRARGSVNYKEPSLNKKMRKPDGITAEEALRLRNALAPNSLSPTKAQYDDADIAPGAASASASPKKSGQGTTHAKMSVPRQTGMRRKSTLPKTGPAVREVSDEDDADDVDDLIGTGTGLVGCSAAKGAYEVEVGEMEEKTRSLGIVSPAKKRNNGPQISSHSASPPTVGLTASASSKVGALGSTARRPSTFRPSSTTGRTASGSDVSSLGLGRPGVPAPAGPGAGAGGRAASGPTVGRMTPGGAIAERGKVRDPRPAVTSSAGEQKEKQKEKEKERDILAEVGDGNRYGPRQGLVGGEGQGKTVTVPAPGTGSGSGQMTVEPKARAVSGSRRRMTVAV